MPDDSRRKILVCGFDDAGAYMKAMLKNWIKKGYEAEVFLDGLSTAQWLCHPRICASEENSVGCVVESIRARCEGGIAFVLPTVFSIANDDEGLRSNVNQLLSQVSEPSIRERILVVVGVQWKTGDENQCVEQLRRVVTRLDFGPRTTVLGLALQGPRKSRTLNVVFKLADALNLVGCGWIDDDVRLEPGCLAHIIDEFRRRQYRGAVGATKVPHRRRSREARFLYRVKSFTVPAMNYPQGCCILVSADVVREGIPTRYTSDDGFVLFELLDPDAPDPMHEMAIIERARCHFLVGADKGNVARRQTSLLIDHHLFLADYPDDKGRYYMANMLFHGFWPIGRFDMSRGLRIGFMKWSIKLILFAWFSRVGAELALRGWCGRPLRERSRVGAADVDESAEREKVPIQGV